MNNQKYYGAARLSEVETSVICPYCNVGHLMVLLNTKKWPDKEWQTWCTSCRREYGVLISSKK